MDTAIRIIHCPLEEVGKHIPANNGLFVVCDRNVRQAAGRIGARPDRILGIEATEQGKVLDTVLKIGRWLMEQGAGRDAFVLGIGGGITTDLVGFAASIYKRGVRFGFVPTTLLSQVDAAIGGKNGVNLDSYKNMLGVIRQPEMTFICPEPLKSLPYGQVVSGAAELLKSFIIEDVDGGYGKAVRLLSDLRKTKDLGAFVKEAAPLISAAAEVKAGIAGRDPFETGERRLLNLGHTFAHAIEKRSGESISHGEAVAMGIILAARLSERLGLAAAGLAEHLEADFKACGLPTACPFPTEELVAAMKKDKKAEGDFIHFVLPLEIGHVETRLLRPEDVNEMLGK